MSSNAKRGLCGEKKAQKLFFVLTVLTVLICVVYYNSYTSSFVKVHVASAVSNTIYYGDRYLKMVKRLSGNVSQTDNAQPAAISSVQNRSAGHNTPAEWFAAQQTLQITGTVPLKSPAVYGTVPPKMPIATGTVLTKMLTATGTVPLKMPTATGTIPLKMPIATGTVSLKMPTATGTVPLKIPTATGTVLPKMLPATGTVPLKMPTATGTIPLKMPKATGTVSVKMPTATGIDPPKAMAAVKVTVPEKPTIDIVAPETPALVSVAPNKSNGNGKKYLIYYCDHKSWCGGWGDRQRGILSIYLGSLAYNRTFGIEMTSPCPIQQFFVPNEINWLLDPKELENKTTLIINAMGKGPPDVANNTEDVIKVRLNSDGSMSIRHHYRKMMPAYVLNVPRPVVFRRVWKKMMKPTKRMEARLKEMASFADGTEQKSKRLLCAHVRIGYSKYLPLDPPKINISSIPILWKFLEGFDKDSNIFLASDNDDVRASAKQKFGERYFDSGGKILHIDRQRGSKEACSGFETSVLDQVMLTHCDVLVVSVSNFSFRAAMLKKIMNETFIFTGKVVSPFSPNRRRLKRSTNRGDNYDVFTID